MLASTIYFMISPVNEGHSELLARTSPTIYDVLIGFFGGGAGIIGLGSRSKAMSSWCGHRHGAYATALHCRLRTGHSAVPLFSWSELSVHNQLHIHCVCHLYRVKLFKYKPVATVDADRAHRVMRIVYTLAILTMLPSIWLTYNMFRQNKFQVNSQRFVTEECRFRFHSSVEFGCLRQQW